MVEEVEASETPGTLTVDSVVSVILLRSAVLYEMKFGLK